MNYKPAPMILTGLTNPLPTEIEDIINTYTGKWLENHTAESLNLFHYTTLEGLKGILTDRSIWCTQINAMNDPSELLYGRNLISSKLDGLIAKEDDGEIISILLQIKNDIGLWQTHDYFFASFCERDNLLSQWRGYAARGGGYSLGFNFNSSSQICTEINETTEASNKPIKINLRRIIYKKTIQEKLVEDFLNALIIGIKEALNKWEIKYNHLDKRILSSQIMMLANNLLTDMMISMKNSAFEEEQEWRLIRATRWDQYREHYRFREKNSELIPFLNTHLFTIISNQQFEFPVTQIRFGPMLDPIKTKEALKLFVKNRSVLDHKIQLKEIQICDAGYTLRV